MKNVKKITDPECIIQDHYIDDDGKFLDSDGRQIGYVDGQVVNLDYKKGVDVKKLKFEIVELRGNLTDDHLLINGRQLNVEPL